MNNNTESPGNQRRKQDKLGFWHLVISTLGAAIGVQNRKNLEKDFSHSSPMPYIVAGVVFTALFMLTLILLVRWVLAE